jgi:glycosyltransferase involved in cell wall biosynthesis
MTVFEAQRGEFGVPQSMRVRGLSGNSSTRTNVLNIWLVNHYANAPYEPGDARHWSHARELMRRGHQVTVISSSFHHLKHEQMNTVRSGRTVYQMVDGVPFVWMPTIAYKSDSISRVAGFFEFGYRVARGKWAARLAPPDLVVGSSPHPFSALGAQRLAARYKVPFFLELRDAWPYVLTEVGGYSHHHPFVLLVDRTMRYLYKRADRIILFSRDSTGELEKMGGDPKKVVWVPHGVDFTLMAEPRPAPRDGIFRVKYIGAHNQWNSLDAILDAAKYLQEKGKDNIEFRFIGDGVRKPFLKARAEAEGIRNAHFDDPIPKCQMADALFDADAFIINNRVDGVSKRWMSFNKIYEYLSARRPVVFGCCAEANPVKDSGAGLIVEAGNHVQIAEAVAKLAAMTHAELDEFGLRGRKHIEEHYSIRAIVNRFEAAALELVEQRRGRAGTRQDMPDLDSLKAKEAH